MEWVPQYSASSSSLANLGSGSRAGSKSGTSFAPVLLALRPVHVTRRDDPDNLVRAAVEDDEREAAVEGLAERRVAAASGSADAGGALEYLFGFLRAVLVAGDVVGIGIVPLEEERASHLPSVVG